MTNEILLHGEIGPPKGITKEQFRAQLAKADPTQELVIRIDSYGGSVFDGFGIYDAIVAYEGPTRCVVEPTAFSIASFIALACDTVEITGNGYFMIHNPAAETFGDDDQHASQAKLLAQLKSSMVEAYAKRMNRTADEVQAMMKSQTYFGAKEAMAAGLVDRVLDVVRPSAVAAQYENMPHRVFAALRNVDSADGDTSETERELPMSEPQKPVAATVQEIKSAFPKAKADFIVRCLERQLPLASVAAAAAEELMKENEELRAQVAAMEEEKAAAKAMEEEAAAAKAMEVEVEEEEEPAAKAKAKGVRPVAHVGSGGSDGPSARERWSQAISKLTEAGKSRQAAVLAVATAQPELHQQYLAEVNA